MDRTARTLFILLLVIGSVLSEKEEEEALERSDSPNNQDANRQQATADNRQSDGRFSPQSVFVRDPVQQQVFVREPHFREVDENRQRPHFREVDESRQRPHFREIDESRQRPHFRETDENRHQPHFREIEDARHRPHFREIDDGRRPPSHFHERPDFEFGHSHSRPVQERPMHFIPDRPSNGDGREFHQPTFVRESEFPFSQSQLSPFRQSPASLQFQRPMFVDNLKSAPVSANTIPASMIRDHPMSPTFTLPVSQFAPIRVGDNHGTVPSRELSFASETLQQQQQQLQQQQPQPNPSNLRNGFPMTFFNMPFRAVSMTPFKVATGSAESSTGEKPIDVQTLVKTAATDSISQVPNSAVKDSGSQDGSTKTSPASGQLRLIPDDSILRTAASGTQPFRESHFAPSMSQPFRGPSEFGGLRSVPLSDEEFMMEHGHQSIDQSSRFIPFHRPMQSFPTRFAFEPEQRFPNEAAFQQFQQQQQQAAMTLGTPITFQMAHQPSSNSAGSIKTTSTDDQKNVTKPAENSETPTSSGLRFRPIGLAPVQFDSTSLPSSHQESLRSAFTRPTALSSSSFSDDFNAAPPGSLPFKPIILRPVKLLSPHGRDITSASAVDDEFKAFMTVPANDQEALALATAQQNSKQNPLKGRAVDSSLEDFELPKRPVKQQAVLFRQKPKMIRVQPVERERHASPVPRRRPSQQSQHSNPAKNHPIPKAGKDSRTQTPHSPRKVSSSFVEYRLQPSYVEKTFRHSGSTKSHSSKAEPRANYRPSSQYESYVPEEYDQLVVARKSPQADHSST